MCEITGELKCVDMDIANNTEIINFELINNFNYFKIVGSFLNDSKSFWGLKPRGIEIKN